jgi:phosphatidylglycerophosphate synthase
VVLTHAVLGFIAAFLLFANSDLWLAAILLQLKTLLDNMDGGLARATHQITQMGRYFDTSMDFLVNIALFIALSNYGLVWLCWLAFVLLTLMLSLDFNAERLYKQAHFPQINETSPPIGAPQTIYRFFKGIYTLLFAPQDKLIETLDKLIFKQITHQDYQASVIETQRVWSDLFSTATLVNLGLSTQMFILGLCLILGHPYWYIYSILFQAVYVMVIQIIRALRLKRYLP